MKKYLEPSAELIMTGNEDVITASSLQADDGSGNALSASWGDGIIFN